MARLTVIEIADAAGFHDLAERLPDDNRRHRYRLRDPAAAAVGGPPLCRHVLRVAGALQVSQVGERFGTEVAIHEPGIPAYCFSTVRTGTMSLFLPGSHEAAEGRPERGLIHQGQGGTRAVTRDGTARTNLWVASAAMDRALAAFLGEAPRTGLAFQPTIDWASGAGPSVQRLLAHVATEFGRPGGLAEQPLALAAFTDLFVHTVLGGLPHSHSERLARAASDVAPRHLRRAEAFMEAQARHPVCMADVAAAAGCSVRSLQNAFRTFRNTTPHGALQRIRLGLARADLLRDGEPVSAVARRYGFSNPSRFSALYARHYGLRPRERR